MQSTQTFRSLEDSLPLCIILINTLASPHLTTSRTHAGLAYSLLAHIPPVFALYTGFFPTLVYTFFGTSRQMSFGPEAMASMLVGATVHDTVVRMVSSTELPLVLNDPNELMKYATVVSFVVGAVTLVLGICRLGEYLGLGSIYRALRHASACVQA